MDQEDKSLNEISEAKIISLIEKLNERFEELKANRRRLKSDLQKAISEIKQMKFLLNQMIKEVKDLKSERNKINVEVRNHKNRRDIIRQQQKNIIQQIKDLECKIATLKKQTVIPERNIVKRLKELKWTYETSPVNLKIERKIVNEINRLESLAEVYSKIRNLQVKIMELKQQHLNLNNEANRNHEIVLKLSQQSQCLHESLKGKFKEIEMLKTKLQDKNSEIKDLISQLSKIDEEIRAVLSKLYKLRASLTRIRIYKNSIRTAKVKEKLVKEILNKIKRGEKLNFEEFKIALELKLLPNS